MSLAVFALATRDSFHFYSARQVRFTRSEEAAVSRDLIDGAVGALLGTMVGDALGMPAEGMTPAEFGAKLFVSKACITCHAVDGTDKTGPHLNGIFGKDIPLTDGGTVNVDENYIRESILNPQVSVVAGFEPVMPTYQGLLKDKQIDALIAYIKSLK